VSPPGNQSRSFRSASATSLCSAVVAKAFPRLVVACLLPTRIPAGRGNHIEHSHGQRAEIERGADTSDVAGEYQLWVEREHVSALTEGVRIPDTAELRAARTGFQGFPKHSQPPFVTRGDMLSSSTFWHGRRLDEWANAWTRYFTGGRGNYMISAIEDSGTMQALTFPAQAGRADLYGVMVLRTNSNYDREAPGTTAAR
jgi:purine nucleoside permease